MCDGVWSQKMKAKSKMKGSKAVEVERGWRRTDFNDEQEAHEDEVCHRKDGALVLDCK